MAEKNKSIIQFIKFGLVGVSNTIVNQIVYMLCTFLGLHYLTASVIAFLISVLNAFFWQTKFVFKEDKESEKRVWWQVLLKTYTAYAFTGLLLNNIFLIMWIDLIKLENYISPLTAFVNGFGLNYTDSRLAVDIAPLLNMVVNIPLNFIINKYWAYQQKKSTQAKDN